MSNRITVVPAAGRDVLDSAWWRRRLVDGDITLKTAKAAKPQGAK
jgi:hypothetical protein